MSAPTAALAPPLRYLGAADVERTLPSLPVRLELVRETLAALAAGAADAPPATCLRPRPTGFADAMPAYAAERDLTAVKWVGGDERNRARGLPYISGLVVLNDSDTGLPIAILDAGAITAARTAAVSAVTVDALAAPGFSQVAVIGFGRQARAHVEALRGLNPAARFRAATSNPPAGEPGVEFFDSAREAVEGAEVVITAIPLSARLSPPLTADWLAPGAIVLPLDDDACLDPGAVAAADHFAVDDPARYRRDRGRGLFEGWPEPDLELAAAIASPPPRAGLGVYMSQGLGLMDAPFAAEVLRSAEERGLGVLLER